MKTRATPWILVGVFLAAGLIFGVGTLVWIPLSTSRFLTARLISAVIAGAVFGTVAVVLIRLSWRRHGGPAEIAERTRAIKAGQLPAGANERWLPSLRVRRQNARQLPWVMPAAAVLMLVLGTSHLADPTPLASTYWFAYAALFIALAGHWVRRGPHDVAVLDRFIADLEHPQV